MNKEQTTALMAKIDNLVVQLRRNGRIKQIKEDGQNYYAKIQSSLLAARPRSLGAEFPLYHIPHNLSREKVKKK